MNIEKLMEDRKMIENILKNNTDSICDFFDVPIGERIYFAEIEDKINEEFVLKDKYDDCFQIWFGKENKNKEEYIGFKGHLYYKNGYYLVNYGFTAFETEHDFSVVLSEMNFLNYSEFKINNYALN